MKPIKIFGTLAETTRLGSSVVIIIIFVSTLEPQVFVSLTLCISSANLVASVSNFGIPIWINVKFDQINLVRARMAILVSTLVFLPSLVIFGHFILVKDVNLNWSLLLISEFLLAGPIAFENRVLLSEMKNHKYLTETLLQTSGRTFFLITIAFFGQPFLFFSFFVFVFFIYFKNHARKIQFSGVRIKSIFQTYIDSASVGSIGMLATFFDSLPIICGGLFLKPVEAATTQIALRITSVALIPSNALASVSMAEKAKSQNYGYIKSHLMFSIFSSLSVVISIFLILNYFFFFDNYPDLASFLWFQLIFVFFRSFHINIGNYLTFKNRNRLRVVGLGAACAFLLSAFFLINFEVIPKSTRTLLLGYLLSEILASALMCFHAKRVKI